MQALFWFVVIWCWSIFYNLCYPCIPVFQGYVIGIAVVIRFHSAGEADVKNTCKCRVDSRFAPRQWETALLCNDVSLWLGASLKPPLQVYSTNPQNTDNITTTGTKESWKIRFRNAASRKGRKIDTMVIFGFTKHIVVGLSKTHDDKTKQNKTCYKFLWGLQQACNDLNATSTCRRAKGRQVSSAMCEGWLIWFHRLINCLLNYDANCHDI